MYGWYESAIFAKRSKERCLTLKTDNLREMIGARIREGLAQSDKRLGSVRPRGRG